VKNLIQRLGILGGTLKYGTILLSDYLHSGSFFKWLQKIQQKTFVNYDMYEWFKGVIQILDGYILYTIVAR
jgi:hypothetical protein